MLSYYILNLSTQCVRIKKNIVAVTGLAGSVLKKDAEPPIDTTLSNDRVSGRTRSPMSILGKFNFTRRGVLEASER